MCRSYNPNSKRCLLCLNEKYEIATYKGDNLLNKRTETINTCKHLSIYLSIYIYNMYIYIYIYITYNMYIPSHLRDSSTAMLETYPTNERISLSEYGRCC